MTEHVSIDCASDNCKGSHISLTAHSLFFSKTVFEIFTLLPPPFGVWVRAMKKGRVCVGENSMVSMTIVVDSIIKYYIIIVKHCDHHEGLSRKPV